LKLKSEFSEKLAIFIGYFAYNYLKRGIRFGKMMSGIYWIKTAGISQMESAFSESKG